ncbi:MAG: uracil-DNA glycosylase [Pseudoduganella sp.]|jgi:DNA polymerase|nr:uracil-DNA glycosylase [Pseudoduganella sp.]
MNDRRSAVFLDEMALGPRWLLRDRVAPAATEAVAADAFTQAAADPQPVAPAAAPVRAAVTPPAAVPEAPAVAEPPPAPAAPARAPGTPSIASTGEDMSWFDDAPTPEFKPQRKKVAPPEQPAAPLQRPQPPAPAVHAAPVYAEPAADEPPSWFDDEQPAAPARAAAPGGQPTQDDIGAMDWPALQAAIAACTRCGRCATRQQAVPGRGDEQATWLALDTAPGAAEDAAGYQFAGDPGYLLDNMLKAVGQSTEKGAYLTSLVKCHAPHAPGAEELQACRPYLERELALTQAKVIVAFGHSTGKGLLGGAARGRIMLHGSVPVVATYHPSGLLAQPADKAKAWQDLCLAKAAHAGRR